MPAIAKQVPGKILSRMRKKGQVLGGKAELAELTKVSKPTIKSIIENGKAHPAVIKKLEEAFDPKKEVSK